jgi:SAM-dependent methyltransferase
MEARSAFDRAAASYGLVGTDFFSDLGALLVRRTGVVAGSSVLDVGAGTGAVTHPAAASSGTRGRVVAVDTSEPMLRTLQRRDRRGDGAPVAPVVMDATRLGFGDDSWDCVVSGLVLSSLPRPGPALDEMCRVLRPGGRLGISVAPGWWWQEDRRWAWHGSLMAELGTSFSSTPSSGPSFVKNLLAGAPLGHIWIGQETRSIRWGSSSEFWAWCWSHGWRSVLEGLSPDELSTYRQRTEDALGPRSLIEGRILATIVTATKR